MISTWAQSMLSSISLYPPLSSMTHFADTFRYILDGVRNSADIEEKMGTRLGGLGALTEAAKTSRTVSSDGCTPSLSGHAVSFLPRHWLAIQG